MRIFTLEVLDFRVVIVVRSMLFHHTKESMITLQCIGLKYQQYFLFAFFPFNSKTKIARMKKVICNFWVETDKVGYLYLSTYCV